MISDIVFSGDLPEAVAGSLAAYAGCIAGAVREAARSVLSVQVFGRKPV